MYFHTSPFLLRVLYPDFVWRVPTSEKIIYLTFDDGPIPGVTEWVLDQLAGYGAKATFFCVGENIQKHPAVFQAIQRAGHAIGNHTYHHLNGWKTAMDAYVANVVQCQQMMNEAPRLFRPPYGRISRPQARFLRTQPYRIVMWHVLTGDFDRALRPDGCLRNAIRSTQPGSIVVFHDSQKAWKNLEYVLPRFLTHFRERAFRFEKL